MPRIYAGMFFCLVLSVSAFPQEMGIVKCEAEMKQVPAWSAPGSAYVVEQLPCGHPITISAFERGYFKIQLSSRTAYVYAKYVSVTDNKQEPMVLPQEQSVQPLQSPQPFGFSEQTPVIQCDSDAISQVPAWASPAGIDIVDYLLCGQVVNIIAREMGDYKIRIGDRVAYVNAKYVRLPQTKKQPTPPLERQEVKSPTSLATIQTTSQIREKREKTSIAKTSSISSSSSQVKTSPTLSVVDKPIAASAPHNGIQVPTNPGQDKLTNADIIQMAKIGLSPEIIIAKVKASSGIFDTSPQGLKQLKDGGVAESVIVAIIYGSNASSSENPSLKQKGKRERIKDDLTTYFSDLQNSVVTVWSEMGHGTGFIVDRDGLIITNQHVIGPSQYIAVQFDTERKVAAKLIASDAEKDVAIIWANLDSFTEAIVAPIAYPQDEQPTLAEGERVFTIGSPLSQRKILTTGVASKIEERAIISDININPGNSGGPLFNSIGEVTGLTTFGEKRPSGPGVSGIVRIEQALPLLDLAKKAIADKQKPEAVLLPVEPKETFPLDAIKESLSGEKKFDVRPYQLQSGDFDVAFITPILKYQLMEADQMAAAKEKQKRTKKSEKAVQDTFRPLDDLKSWAEYAGEYKPVLLVRARPKLGEGFWSAFGRGLAANYGALTPAKLRFKTDFYRMRLLCDGQEIQPIHPAKVAHILNEQNILVNVTDATYEGFYSYPANGITSSCAEVVLELFSEKDPEKATRKTLDAKTIDRITQDFRPYLEMRHQ